MNDHRDEQPRGRQPEWPTGGHDWPTGEDPDAGASSDKTGVWKPSFDDSGPIGRPNRPPAGGNPPAGPPPRRPGGQPGPGGPPPGQGGPRPPMRPGGPVPPGAPPGGPPGGRPGPNAPTARAGMRGTPPQEIRTDHIQPVETPSYAPEPALLTHRDDDYASNSAFDDFVEPRRPLDDEPAGGRDIGRIVRRSVYGLITLGILGPIAVFFVMYQFVSVPNPQAIAATQNQPMSIYYGDGSKMDTITSGTRQLIGSNEIPANVRHAVEAAEDETFESNAGFDMKAILRTAYNQASGGTGGGSTISQEYIKQATGNAQHSLTRKVTEVVQAFKMNNQTSKQDILAAYLNIVYFGRGANGIEAAAHAYYNTTPDKLTAEQAALIAGMIQLPGYADDKSYEHKRYSYVLGRLVANHWVSAAEADSTPFPTPLPESQTSHTPLTPVRQYIENAVLGEMAQNGWTKDALEKSGAQIHTTISPNAQTDAENSVNQVMAADTQYTNGQPISIGGKPVAIDGKPVMGTEAASLVSVDPRTGGIIAYYAGDGSTAYDLAQTPHQPGSSFKPYVFAAGLQNDPQQIGLQAVYDGSDKQTIAGHLVHNSDGEGSPQMTVWDAMTQSVNTVFYKMGTDVGTKKVRDAAIAAGIPDTINPAIGGSFTSLQNDSGQYKGSIDGGISIGQYPVRVVDQAQGYATFANGGNKIPVHFVTKVTDTTGSNVLYQFDKTPTPAFGDQNTSSQIAGTVTQSLTKVASASKIGLANNRPNAAKTGTQGYNDPVSGNPTPYNSDAWTVGYTPDVVTAVWFGHKDHPAPLGGNYRNGVGSPHQYSVFGREEPGAIWQSYMDSWLGNTKSTPFPTVPPIGGSWNFVTNSQASTDTNPPGTQSNTASSQPDQSSQTSDQPTDTLLPIGGGGHHHGPTTTTTTSPVCDPLAGCQTMPGGGGGGGGVGPGGGG